MGVRVRYMGNMNSQSIEDLSASKDEASIRNATAAANGKMDELKMAGHSKKEKIAAAAAATINTQQQAYENEMMATEKAKKEIKTTANQLYKNLDVNYQEEIKPRKTTTTNNNNDNNNDNNEKEAEKFFEELEPNEVPWTMVGENGKPIHKPKPGSPELKINYGLKATDISKPPRQLELPKRRRRRGSGQRQNKFKIKTKRKGG